MKLKQTLSVLAIACATMFSTSVLAGFSNEQLLTVLLGNGAITQQQHDELLGMAKDEEKKAEAMTANDIKVTLDKGSLQLQSQDESFKMQIGGRIMVDAASFDNGGDQYNDGSELRRARLFVAGTVWHDWHYKGQYDFANDGVGDIKDAWIKYSGLNDVLEFPLGVTFGHFKEAFSLEALTSSKYITFIERSMATEVFAPGRNIGLGFNSYGQVMDGGWSAAVGYFGHGFDDTDDGDESYGYVGRATFAPIATKTRVLHIGGAVEHRKWKGRSLRLRARPETHIGDTRIVDTRNPGFASSMGDFNADDITTWNVDTAGVYGPLSFQAEYFHQDVDSVAHGDLNFDGWYAYASYFLTGESRAYDARHGLFKRTKPNSIVGKGGYGAWELAARYSAINLNDGAINGGRAENITLGVNWYATPTIRFMGNYVITDASRSDKEDPNIFQLRGQVDF